MRLYTSLVVAMMLSSCVPWVSDYNKLVGPLLVARAVPFNAELIDPPLTPEEYDEIVLTAVGEWHRVAPELRYAPYFAYIPYESITWMRMPFDDLQAYMELYPSRAEEQSSTEVATVQAATGETTYTLAVAYYGTSVIILSDQVADHGYDCKPAYTTNGILLKRFAKETIRHEITHLLGFRHSPELYTVAEGTDDAPICEEPEWTLYIHG